jgi:hypothetical protein
VSGTSRKAGNAFEVINHKAMGPDYSFPQFIQAKIGERGDCPLIPQFRVECRELDDEERPL